jgi:hypothetical protein
MRKPPHHHQPVGKCVAHRCLLLWLRYYGEIGCMRYHLVVVTSLAGSSMVTESEMLPCVSQGSPKGHQTTTSRWASAPAAQLSICMLAGAVRLGWCLLQLWCWGIVVCAYPVVW